MPRPHAQPPLPIDIPPTDVWLRERAARLNGHVLVAGVDEAGRGPLAGPVVAAAVLLPMGVEIAGINDSKLLNAEQREDLAIKIRAVAIAIGVGEADHLEIDSLNIAVAGRLAMRRAVEALSLLPDYLLVDGFALPEVKLPQEALIKGDRRSASIMAGGIIAKTTRDAAMRAAARVYPGYGFDEHFGYATPSHAEALARLGPCRIHRRSFHPVAVAEVVLAQPLVDAMAGEAILGGSETAET
jgi:ribonuclease HII